MFVVIEGRCGERFQLTMIAKIDGSHGVVEKKVTVDGEQHGVKRCKRVLETSKKTRSWKGKENGVFEVTVRT